jgi:hypothetical protein
MPRWLHTARPSGPTPAIMIDNGDGFEAVSPDQWWPLSAPKHKIPAAPVGGWELRNLSRAKFRAMLILERMGFDVRARNHVVFLDRNKQWWSHNYSDSEKISLPAEKISVCVGVTTADDLPLSLSESLGGVDGSFDWALMVMAAADEWPEAFDRGDSDCADFAFQIGQRFGFFEARRQARNRGPKDRSELDGLLMQIISQAPWMSNAELTRRAFAESDSGSEIGLKLRAAGLLMLQEDAISRRISRLRQRT